MSQLILNFFRKDDSLKLSVTATGHCNYETTSKFRASVPTALGPEQQP